MKKYEAKGGRCWKRDLSGTASGRLIGLKMVPKGSPHCATACSPAAHELLAGNSLSIGAAKKYQGCRECRRGRESPDMGDRAKLPTALRNCAILRRINCRARFAIAEFVQKVAESG